MKIFLKSAFLTIALLFCLATPAYALDVTLQWDANQETNLAGYKIYYRAGSSGGGVLANYNGTGAYEGNSPIDMPLALDENPDPDIVEFTVTDIPDGQTYYFVVTAYNDDVPPLESGPSNEENTTAAPSDTTPPYVTNRSPAPGATGVAVNTNITLELTDAGVGVDQSTIIMRVSGSVVTPSISGTSAAYTLSYNPSADFAYDQTVIVEVDAADLSGNAMARDSYSFTTGSAPDTTPPIISNVQASSITDTSAVITWTTNEPSDSEIQFGTSSATWGSYDDSRRNDTLVTNHSVTLIGLSADTTYYFRVGSIDSSLNGPTISNEGTFTTDAPFAGQNLALGKPVTGGSSDWGTLFSYLVDGLWDEPGLGWSADAVPNWVEIDLGDDYQVSKINVGPFNRSSDTVWNYNDAWNIKYRSSTDTQWKDFTNVVKLSGAGTLQNPGISITNGNPGHRNSDDSYKYYSFTFEPVIARYIRYEVTGGDSDVDVNGNEIEVYGSSDPVDTTPPVISNVQVASTTDTTAVITWTSDEASDSEVQYGTTSGSYPSSRNSTNMVTSHSVTLTGLNDNTTYYFRVGSTDGSGNGPTISNEMNFTTNPTPDTTPPVISSVQVTSITQTSAVISWTTNEPSYSEVQYDSVSRLWGSYPWGENDTSLVTSHSITLTRLEADTTYYFRVGSTDGSGNGPTTSNEMTFTTEVIPVPPSSPQRLKIIRTQ